MLSKASNQELMTQVSAGWVSLGRAARFLGVAYSTASKMYHGGRLRGTRIGGTIRIPSSELSRVLREGGDTIVAMPMPVIPRGKEVSVNIQPVENGEDNGEDSTY